MVFSSNVLPSWPARSLSGAIGLVAKRAFFGQILSVSRVEVVFHEIQLGIEEAYSGNEEYSTMAKLHAKSGLLQLLFQLADAFIRGSAYLSVVRENIGVSELFYAKDELDSLERFLLSNRALLGRESHRLFECRLLLARQSLNRRLTEAPIKEQKDLVNTGTPFFPLLATFAAGYMNGFNLSGS